MAEIPERLKTNGRPEDQAFAPDEKLFRRYTSEHYVDGQFSALGIRLNEPPSFNREKFSEPADVLLSETNQYESYGVLSLLVQHVVLSLPPGVPTHALAPKHVPLHDNYSHSEIWCRSLQANDDAHLEPNKTIKKLFRAILSQHAVVEIEATI